MAKVPTVPGIPRGALPLRQRDGLTIYHHGKTGMIVRVSRNRKLSPTPQVRIDNATQFAAVQAMLKQAVPEDVIAARALSQGTPYVPRDLLTKAAYGTLLKFTTTDGQTYSGVRVTPADIQQMLDTISTTKGAIIYFDGADWAAIVPGHLNQVLTIQADGTPDWADSGGGGGGGLKTYTEQLTGVGYTVPTDATFVALYLGGNVFNADNIALPAAPADGTTILFSYTKRGYSQFDHVRLVASGSDSIAGPNDWGNNPTDGYFATATYVASLTTWMCSAAHV